MPETLEIRSLSGIITLGNDKDARVLIPRIKYRGCTPPVPVIPGPPPLDFLTPYNQEIRQFLKWLGKFSPQLSPGSMGQCVAAIEPFFIKDKDVYIFRPASFGSLSLKDDFSHVFSRSGESGKGDKKIPPLVTQIGKIGYRAAVCCVVGKYFSCDKTLQEQLKPFNSDVTDESISEYPYSLGSDFTHEDFKNLYEGVSQFLYLDRNGSSFAHSLMEKFSEALGSKNNGRVIFTPENFGSETLLHQYFMWSIVELASAIVVLLVFGELELAQKLQALIQTYESSVWPLCLLEHRHDENKPPHSTTILLLCS